MDWVKKTEKSTDQQHCGVGVRWRIYTKLWEGSGVQINGVSTSVELLLPPP